MARNSRFTEARLWMAAGTISLLLATWAALAVQDAVARSDSNDSGGASTRQVTQRTTTTHTRTRGS